VGPASRSEGLRPMPCVLVMAPLTMTGAGGRESRVCWSREPVVTPAIHAASSARERHDGSAVSRRLESPSHSRPVGLGRFAWKYAIDVTWLGVSPDKPCHKRCLHDRRSKVRQGVAEKQRDVIVLNVFLDQLAQEDI
jgi:hypothetical protein